MDLQRAPRTPVMCQMANGHTIINTGVHPIDYFIDDELWADCLIRMREMYDFDGILCHKPGRVHGLMDLSAIRILGRSPQQRGDFLALTGE